MVDQRNIFDQPVENDMKICETFEWLQLVKQGLDADQKAIQKIKFTENVDEAEREKCFSLLKNGKKLF